MTVRVLRGDSLCSSFVSLLPCVSKALWGAVSPPPVDLAPAPVPNPTRPPPRLPSSSRATPQTTAPRSAPATGPSTSAPQINCFCGKPSVEFTVKKESANKGRQFRRCGQPENCDFFEWTDEPPRDGSMKHGGRPPNPPSIPAKRSRTDDTVRVFARLVPRLHIRAFFFLLSPSGFKEILSV